MHAKLHASIMTIHVAYKINLMLNLPSTFPQTSRREYSINAKKFRSIFIIYITLHNIICFSESFFLCFLYFALLPEASAALLESVGDAATFILSSLDWTAHASPALLLNFKARYRGKRLRFQMTQARWPRIQLKLLIRPRGLANYTRSRQCTPLCVATSFRVHLFTSELRYSG